MQTISNIFWSEHTRRLVAWCLWCTILAAAAAYVYFLVLAVTNVVLREELARELGEAEAQVSMLETEYLSASNVLSEETAVGMGLVAVAPSGYVTVDSAAYLSRAE